MPSIADELRAKRVPVEYPVPTFKGKTIRVECPDYVMHQFYTLESRKCPKCKDLDWVLTEAGKELYALFLAMRNAKPLFKQLLEES